jgi:hypothetical protein
MDNDATRWFQFLPGWIALFVGWFVALVGWGVRIEKMMAKGAGRQDELASGQDEVSRDVKDLEGRLRSQGDSIIELRTDVRYIREGIDELRRRKR